MSGLEIHHFYRYSSWVRHDSWMNISEHRIISSRLSFSVIPLFLITRISILYLMWPLFLPTILWLLSKQIWFDHWIRIIFKLKVIHLLLWIHNNLITNKQDVQLLKLSILSHKSQWTLLQEKQSIMIGIRRRILYYPISLEETSQLCFSVLEIALYTEKG